MRIFRVEDADWVVLSPRQRQILALVCTGMPNKVIAFHLRIAESTVKHHLCSLTTGLRMNRTQLALWATSHPSVFSGAAAPVLFPPNVNLVA